MIVAVEAIDEPGRRKPVALPGHAIGQPVTNSMSIELPTTATPEFRLAAHLIPDDSARMAEDRYGMASRGILRLTDDDETLTCLLANGGPREAFVEALRGPCSHVVELDEDGGSGALWLGVPGEANARYVSMTTPTAYAIQPAVVICDALSDMGVLDPSKRSPVELCLHEAIANGIVHGNLGVSSAAKDEPEGYRLFSQQVNERLLDQEFRRRRLDVHARWRPGVLELSVCDGGAGFDTAAVQAEPNGNARSGRGFLFMRALAESVEIRGGGRCTILRFSL